MKKTFEERAMEQEVKAFYNKWSGKDKPTFGEEEYVTDPFFYLGEYGGYFIFRNLNADDLFVCEADAGVLAEIKEQDGFVLDGSLEPVGVVPLLLRMEIVRRFSEMEVALPSSYDQTVDEAIERIRTREEEKK